MTLERMNGKDFEEIVRERNVEYKGRRLAHVSRCGVQSTYRDGEWMPIQSLPDFEGVTSFAHQFIFDCKVCSQASFDLSKYRKETNGPKTRQLSHMRERSNFGVVCFFLMHWHARQGKTFSQPEVTYLFPICNDLEFWKEFDRAEKKIITRTDCESIGVEIRWNCYGDGRKPRPDYLPAVLARIEAGNWNLIGASV